MSHRLNALIVFLLLTGVARAEERKSPDGNIAVTVPDPARFTAQIDLPPKVIMSWQSEDQAVRMLVSALPTPPGPPPSDTARAKTNYEVGFMRELNSRFANGKLLHSVVELRNGHEVFVMSGQGESEGTTVYFTQAITITAGNSYVVAVIGFGIDTRTNPDATAFIKSFKILDPHPSGPLPSAPPVTEPVQQQKAPVDQVAYTAGMVAGVCLFIAGIAWVVNRFTRSTGKKPTRRRPKRNHLDDDDDAYS